MGRLPKCIRGMWLSKRSCFTGSSDGFPLLRLNEKAQKNNRWLLSTVAGGFGLGMAHHLTTSWWIPVFVMLTIAFRKSFPKDLRFWITACLIAGIGLCSYVLLPWRSAQQPFLDYGATSASFVHFWSHITGQMFGYRLGFVGWDGLVRNGGIFFESLGKNWPWPLFVGILTRTFSTS